MEKHNYKNTLISVIMPAYNAEKTIAKSIQSVLLQDYRKIELIVVNDGSTDRTENICKNIKDERLIIINQDNMGLSGARNTGLTVAKGDFVSFVDSDDWIEPNYVSLLYESINTNNASMSICGMVRDFPNKLQQYISFKKTMSFSDCLNNESFLSLLEGGLINSCCNKLYRKDIININELSFSGKVLVEDIEFNLKYMRYSNIINTISDCPYHYVVVNGSLTSQISEVMFQNYIGIHTFLLENLSKDHKEYANRFVYHQYISIFFKYLSKVANGMLAKDDVYPILKKHMNNSLIRQSFNSYHPSNYKELIVFKCLQYCLFDLLVLYLKYKR